jgi:ATP-dependent helicase Lhr and Lhr-like helicase
MSNIEDLDRLRQHHAEVHAAMPRTWNAFFSGFGGLRPVQLQSIPPIVGGSDVLITAPTAGGKTQAAMAPLCERLLGEGWSGLSVLLITPTRALVNDLYDRLATPLSNLRIALGRKTSDHAMSKGGVYQVLITTPESLESLMTFRREVLVDIRAVVLDEIHLLDGTPRGDQLRTLLNRLTVFIGAAPSRQSLTCQRVAMSATVDDPDRLAGTFLSDSHKIISIPGQRRIDAVVVRDEGTDADRAETAVAAIERLRDCRKALIFVNSRKQVDAASHFRRRSFESTPVYGHHGSLSKAERENIEARFKQDERALCVATMTLEVGIDIGDVDLVVCMDPPFSISSFLQRIGRGCRRLQGATRVLCVARDLSGELMFNAMLQQAVAGIPAGPQMPYRRSVLVQQTLAYLRQVSGHRRTRKQILRVLSSQHVPAVSDAMVNEILNDMVANQLLYEKSGILSPASEGWAFIESSRIYSNISDGIGGLAIVDADTGNTIATVSHLPTGSSGLSVAGRGYSVVSKGPGNTVRVRGSDSGGQSPRYRARSLPYAFDVGMALQSMLKLEPNELALCAKGQTLIIWTWLGQRLNAILGRGLSECGHKASVGSFALSVQNLSSARVIEVLQQAVEAVETNLLGGSIAVERFVDLGPYMQYLSEAQQSAARLDFVDTDFLRSWVAALRSTRSVALDSEFGRSCAALMKVR